MITESKKTQTKELSTKQPLFIDSVTIRLFNYKCIKCGSTYTKLKKRLNYSDCQVYKGRNPNPILCGGRLVSTD